MPEDTPTDEAPKKDTPDEAAKNTGGAGSGADTDTAKNPADEKQFTKAELDAEVTKRISREITKRVNAELKKHGIDPDSGKTPEDWQRKAEDAESRARTLEAKETLFDYVDDPKHKVNLKPESRRLFWKLAKDELQFDDEGKPTNVREVVTAIKEEAPTLFVSSKGSVDAGVRGVTAAGVDMNQLIRRSAGREQ